MQEVTVKTVGMHCPSCSMLIEMNVADLPGIGRVRASSADGTTVVQYAPGRVTPEEIVKAIREAGYEAELAEEKE